MKFKIYFTDGLFDNGLRKDDVLLCVVITICAFLWFETGIHGRNWKDTCMQERENRCSRYRWPIWPHNPYNNHTNVGIFFKFSGKLTGFRLVLSGCKEL